MSETTEGAVVVGGASGIGAAVVERLRAEAVPVVVWDVAGEPDVRCDITDAGAIDDATVTTIELIGVPRWVTVCAGVGHAGMLLDVGADEWDRVMHVNARGPWLVMRSLAARMIDVGVRGSLVATSSVSSRLVDRSMGAYCASKAALDILVRVAAFEWGSAGLRVNAVGPGVTRTPMLGPLPTDTGWLADVAHRTPLGRLGEADEVAAAIVALHGLEWVTGQVLDADGGLSLHSPIDSYGSWARPAEGHGR
ncbi:MAG TPA: SDR family oxidoreductase [Microthrixaceae bacterium]|nr:SDR family oxidoreductase [Microthrixaceae bacterium]